MAQHPIELLQELPRDVPAALVRDGRRWRLMREPVEQLAIPAGQAVGAFDALRGFLGRHRSRTVAGWLGYDLGLDVESWPVCIEEDFAVPVLCMTAYRRVEDFDVDEVPAPPELPPATELLAHTTRADYERRVAAVVEHIRNGDIFQANLTQPFSGRWDGDPRELFWRLCSESPAPRAAYVEDGQGTCVLSSSPEEYLERQGQRVRTRPIKGTRPRSADPLRDAELLAELRRSRKDEAELAMIVDLMRNDLGKVAEVDSVSVGPFPEHGSFAQVHHLFATVRATLRAGVDHVDLLRATFPGGSITGCPKLRCMEILETLELARRGVYTGAIGTLGPGDAMSLNIAIRTLVWRQDRLRCNAGGAITALSDPAAEFEETLHKMAGIERALQCRVEVPGEAAAR
jgi:para-aminobenzoate synthetase component 1